jgi:hypothetical protein
LSARPYITCRDLIGFLADYFEGALTEMQSTDFGRHLVVCVSCRAYLATYEKTMRAGIAVLRDDSANEDAPEDLIRAVLKVRGRLT